MERRITYPFKKFVRNIIIGLCFVMLAFCAMPVYNLISNNVNKPVDAAGVNVNFYAYRYNSSGKIEKITTTKKWWGKYYYSWTQDKGDQNIFLTTDFDKYSKRKAETGTSILSSTGYKNITLESGKPLYAGCEKEYIYSVGFFSKPTFKAEDLICTGVQITAEDAKNYKNIYILYCGDTYLNFNYGTSGIQVGSLTWSRSINKSDKQKIFNQIGVFSEGQLFTYSTPIFEGTKAISNNKTYKLLDSDGNHKLTFSDENFGFACWIASGCLQMVGFKSDGDKVVYGRKLSDVMSSSFSGGTFTCNVNFVCVVASDSSKLLSYESGKVVFNIRSDADLQFLAKQVNSGYMNQSLKSNYIVKLQEDKISYTGNPIGISSGNFAFKGEFDGNGKTITNANITPYYDMASTHWYSYAGDTRVYCQEPVSPTFGLFGCVDGGSVKKLNVENVSNKAITATRNYDVKFNMHSSGYDWYDIYTTSSVKTYTELLAGQIAYPDYLQQRQAQTQGEPIDNKDISYTNSCFGSLCGYATNMATFEDVTIGVVALNIKYFGGYNVGGLIGRLENSSVNNCEITNYVSINAQKLIHENSATAGMPNNICGGSYDTIVGGFVGYDINSRITNSVIKDISKDRVAGRGLNITINGESTQGNSLTNRLGTPNRNTFSAGGFVGRLENNTVDTCSVLSGNITVTNLYYAGSLDFGGVVGTVKNGNLNKCYSGATLSIKVNLNTENQDPSAKGWIKGNQGADYINVGGLVGKFLRAPSEGKYIARCEYIGDISVYPNNWFDAITNPNVVFSRFCMVGGGIGSVETMDGNGNITTGGTLSYYKNETIINTLTIGESGNTAGYTFVGYYIGNWYGPNLNSNGRNNNNLGVIKKINATMNKSAYLGIIGVNNNSCGAGNFVKSYYVEASTSGTVANGSDGSTSGVSLKNSKGFAYHNTNWTSSSNSVNKLSNGTKVISAIENDFYYNAGKFNDKVTKGVSAPFINAFGAKTITIDFSLVNIDGRNIQVSGGSNYISKNENGLLNKVYCSVTESGKTYYTGITQPHFTFTMPNASFGSASALSYNTKADGTGVSYDVGGTYDASNFSSTTLYPIFGASTTIYSPTPISVDGTNLNKENDSKAKTINSIEYKITCTSASNSGFYAYVYTVEKLNSIEKFSATELKNIISCSESFALTDSALSFASDLTLNAETDYSSYTQDATDCLETYYLQPYRSYSLEYANNSKTYNVEYNNNTQNYLFYGDLSGAVSNQTSINFSGLDCTSSQFEIVEGNITYYYTAIGVEGFGAKRNGAELIGRDSGSYTIAQKNYWECCFVIVYKITNKKTVKVDFIYHDENKKAGKTTNGTVSSENDALEPKNLSINAPLNADSNTSTISETMPTYNDATGSSPTYAFIGWTVGENGSVLMLPGDEITFTVSTSNDTQINIYPKFVTKGDKKVALSTLSKSNNVWQIGSVEDLATFAYKVNMERSASGNYELTKNIDMTSVSNFMPIGLREYDSKNNAYTFTGAFNGNKYVISNLTIDNTNIIAGYSTVSNDKTELRSYRSYATGLFGFVGRKSDNSIKNISLININYSSKSVYVGGVVGCSLVSISNCLVEGALGSDQLNSIDVKAGIGGIVGYINQANIESCVAKVRKVNGTTKSLYSIAGWLVTNHYNTYYINNSFDVTGTDVAGFAYIPKVSGLGFVKLWPIRSCYTNYNFGAVAAINNNAYKGIGKDKDVTYESFDAFYDAMNAINTTTWGKDSNVNGNRPYLKDVGITNAKFVIDLDEYIVTETEKTNFKNGGAQLSGNKLTLTKDYFILDSYNYNRNLYELKCSNNVIFNSLVNYTFDGYEMQSEPNEDGSYPIINSSSNSNLVMKVFINQGGIYNLKFTPKTIKIKIMASSERSEAEDKFKNATVLKEESVKVGETYTTSDNGLDALFADKMPGWEMTGFRLRTLTTSGSSYLDILYNNNLRLSTAGSTYFFGRKFVVQIFENFCGLNGNTNEPFIALFARQSNGLEKVNYKLKFNIYDTDANGNISGGWKELTTFAGNYNNKITYPKATDVQVKGKQFTGWYYIDKDGKEVDFNYENIPELRLANFNATKNSDSDWEINLYPKYVDTIYKIYYDSARDNKSNSLDSIFTKQEQNVVYNESYHPYSDCDTEKKLFIDGYILKYFEVTNKATLLTAGITEDEINDLINNMNNALTSGSTFTYSIAHELRVRCVYEKIIIYYDAVINVKNTYQDVSLKASQDVIGSSTSLIVEASNVSDDWWQYKCKIEEQTNLKINFDLPFGTRVKKIYSNISGGYSFNFDEITSFNAYFGTNEASGELEKIFNQLKYYINQDAEITIELENLIDENLEIENDGTTYKIKSSKDLANYFYRNLDDTNKIAMLQNNIDITGYNFTISSLNGTLDGDGYVINGYTCVANNSENWSSFIKQNNGTIRNVTFNNVMVLSSSGGSVLYWNGIIGINNGTIKHVYVKGGKVNLKDAITKNDNEYIGLLVGTNYKPINNVKVVLDFATGIDFTGFSFVTGKNSANLQNVEVGGSLDVHVVILPIQGGQKDTKIGYLSAYHISGNYNYILVNSISSTYIDSSTVTNVDVNSIDYVADTNSTSWTVGSSCVNYNKETPTSEKSGFVFAYPINGNVKRLVLQSVDCQLYKVNITTNRVIQNLKLKISDKEYSELSGGTGSVYLYSELNNSLGFKQTYLDKKYYDVGLNFSYNNKDVTDKFSGQTQVWNKSQGTNWNYYQTLEIINTEIKNKCDEFSINFNYVQKTSSSKLRLIYSTANPPKFTSYEILNIQKAFEVINGWNDKVNFNYSSIYAQDGITNIGYETNLIPLRYFDNVKLNINLPSYAKISTIEGLRVNNILKNDSLGKTEYNLEEVLTDDTTYTIYLERNAINLTLNLNKSGLEKNEKAKINFSFDFYSKAENNATLYGEELVITIPPKNVNGELKYNAPNLKGVLDYVNNGICYKFIGFGNASRVIYYDSNLENIKELTESITLVAFYEPVEYTIKIDNLNGKIYYPLANGYSVDNEGAKKVFKFDSTVNLPTVKHVENEQYYTLLGYKLGEKFISNGNTTELLDEYKKLNLNYINNAVEKLITITPVYSENSYTTTFNASSTELYPAYVIDENGEHQESVTYSNLTISLINSLVPPKSVKEHHSFKGYKTLDGKYVITYNENENNFEYNASLYDIWLSDNEFYAYYEIDKVNVTINCKDVNETILDVEITNDQGITYAYDLNQITFKVDYNTTNFELLELNILNEGYRFNSYIIDGVDYDLSYVFIEDVTLSIRCEYKIEFITQNGEISSEYINRVKANYNITLDREDSGDYTFYSTLKTIQLPQGNEVLNVGKALVGYTLNGQVINELNILKPCSVVFIYTVKEYTVTIKNNSFTTIRSNYRSYGITKVTDIEDGKELSVKHGSKLIDIVENVITLNLPLGERLEKYTFNDNDIARDYEVTENGELKAITFKLNYEILIYDKENSSDSYKLFEVRQGHYNDEIKAYTPKVTDGFRFDNFSLNEDKPTPYFVLPNNMPALDEDTYSGYATYDESRRTYSLNIYAHYMSIVTVTIKYQDYQNGQDLDFNIVKNNCLDNYEYTRSGNVITFAVDTNTTNLILPEVELTTSGYTFDSYIVGTELYNATSYAFTQATEILVKCKYLVTFLAGRGEISPLYTSSLKDLNANIDGTNNIYTFNQERSSLILPTSEQVTNEGYNLVGFTQDGKNIGLNESIVITKPTTITFNYEIIVLTVELTGENCEIQEAVKSNNYILSGSYKVVNNKASFKVNYGTEVTDIITDLQDPTCKIGYSFTGYLYNGNEITSSDKIIQNNDIIEVKTVINTYKIIINKQDGTTKEYVGKYNDSLDPYIDRVIGNYYGNFRYNGLSYISDRMERFDLPSAMPDLKNESPYSAYVKETEDYTYVLNVYENYTDVVFVTINYKDYQNNEQLNYAVNNYNNVNNLENFNETSEKITFVVEKGTKNVALPEVRVTTEGYNFVSYMVGENLYSENYVFDADTEILVKCSYLVRLYTNGGTLTDSYIRELENTNPVTINAESYGYSFITEKGTFTLPDKDNVIRVGNNLDKFEGDVNITDIENAEARKVNVTKPISISFTYNESVYTLTLTATNCYAPNKVDLSVDKINGYNKVDEHTLKISVVHGIKVKSVIEALGSITTDNGYSFKGFTYNGNEILDSDIVTEPGKTIEAIGVKNTYTIEIYENNNETPAYIQENKHYNDSLDKYIPSEINRYRYDCLSLKQNSLVKIDMPSSMPALEREYAEYCKKTSEFNYKLKIYAVYVETVQVTIKYQDKDNRQNLDYEILTNNCLDNYTDERNGNEIVFRVDKNSKGIVLPVVNIKTNGYTFVSYMVGEDVYKTSYTFTQDTIILVKCSYLVTFNTLEGVISDSYIQKNNLTKQTQDGKNIYTFKVTNGELTLPTTSQVSWVGRNLVGYTQDGTTKISLNEKANITKPTEIVFNYVLALRKITLTGANCKISETNSSNIIQNYKVVNNIATFDVTYNTKVTDIIKGLVEPKCYNGYVFKGYLFNGKVITDEDIVTVDSKLEIITSLNTYIIEVYELGEKVFTSKHYYGENVEEYIPTIYENKKFRNLSLVDGSEESFTMPTTMPALEREYPSDLLTKTDDTYTLKVYANYYETVKVEIIYQDYDNNNYLTYAVENYYDVQTYDYFVENELEHKITFEVIKGTRVKLPKVTIKTEGYKFISYMKGNAEVNEGTDITMSDHTTILVKCSYLVKFNTFGYGIENYTGLIQQVYGYCLWQTKGQLTLPNASQVKSGARPLIGFTTTDGEEIVNNVIEIDRPKEIDFIYGSSLVKLTFTTPNAKILERLPVGQTVIKNYTILGLEEAEFEVNAGTSVQDIKNILLSKTLNTNSGYTFVEYEFSESDTITKDGYVTAKVLQNEYSIKVYEPNNAGNYILKQTITKHFGESITETYTPSEIKDKTYLALSLNQNTLIKFNIPSVMTELDKEYTTATKNLNVIELKVYAYYISYITVSIQAQADCKLPQEFNLTDYSGGGMFNKEVTFKITAENIINNNITLPIPEVQNLLQYATFKGYSFEGEIVVDGNGKLLENFVYNKENITLNYEFEYNNYDFNVYAKYSSLENIFDFETTTLGFTKQVKFNELIGTLPVINLDNYVFKGYYLSDNKDLLLSDSDVKIADINGNLLDGYKVLSQVYFNSLMLKNIVAKYDYDYVFVTVKSNNLTLGRIERITTNNGENLVNEIIEGGYRVKILKGTGIIVSSFVYDRVGEFDSYTSSGIVTIENPRNTSTKIENITEDIIVTANFNYIYFNIIYMVDGERDLTLTPNRFNVDEKVELPQDLEKSGYNFAGWYLEESLINKIDAIDKGTYTNDVTVYAKFVAKSLQLNIHLSNLNNYQEVININVTYGKIIENLPRLSENGYNFVGIFTEKEKGGIRLTNNSKYIFTDNLDVYAYFEETIANTLTGEGTEYSPYLIENFEEFKIFANLINYSSLNNEKVYFKLTNNIVLEEDIIINNFKANFDGDSFVIYSNNHIKAYKTLTNLGEIQMNLGLFGENNGVVTNLIMVNKAIINIEDVTLLNLGNIAGVNNGSIDNVIVYYNVNINYNNNINLGDICANNENVTNYSVYNSKLTLNSVENTNHNMLDKHLHSKNTSVLNVENNQYVVKTSEELAYLLTLTSIDKDVVIKNDIDLKGKIFESINYDINIISNGYIIRNLVSLNNNYVLNNVTLNSIAFEDIVNINLFNNSNFILNANRIEKTYLTFSINNSEYLIENNNGEIVNSYFIANNGTFINTNNGTILNSYVYKLNVKTEDTINNFVKITDESSVDEFISKVDNSIWFKDSKNIMGTGILPSMYTIGNYVVKLVYDENTLSVMSYNDEEVYTTIVTRNSEDLLYLIYINDYNYEITEILVNSVSNLEKLEIIEDGYLFPLYKTDAKITEVEFIASVRDVKVTYKGQVEVDGAILDVGKFELDGEEQDKVEKEVKSGTEITVKALDTEDYYFTSWEDFKQDATRTDEITDDTVIVANYAKKITYRLRTSDVSNLTITNLNSLFTISEEYGYIIKLKKSENINDYLPKVEELNKPEYTFAEYYISQLNEYTYDVFLIFSEDYVNVNIVYEDSKVTANLLSSVEYSQVNTNLIVIKEKNENVYTVLRGYTLTLKLTPNFSYLTKILINGEELEYDYNSLVNVTDEISFDILIDRDTEIVIEMQEILINTTFVFDENLCQLELKNALIDDNNLVTSKKGTPLLFKLTMLEQYVLGNFELNDEEVEFEMNDSGEYIYIPNIDGTIKINIVEKQVTVKVLYTLGGEVLTNVETTTKVEDETFENGYEFNVKSGEGFRLYLINEDNYQISQIYKSSASGTQSLNVKQIVMNNVTEDLVYTIRFEKLPTWLDIDEEGNPLRFNLVRFSGAGVQTSPYIIDNRDSLLTLAYNVNVLNINYQGVYFKAKTKDMTLDFSTYYFSSIGNDTTSFAGIILGNNLKLRGIRIVGNRNVGIFKTLDTSAIVKSVTIEGNISGNYLIGSICGTNNGTIIGCKNSANINSENAYNKDDNILGGICAVNNGTISRTSNEGFIGSISTKTAGICAENNGTIENIYNTGYLNIANINGEDVVLAGICADNKGQIRYGYNDSRLNYYNNLTTYSGTSIDNNGTTTDVYYNSNKLTASLGIGKTYEELTQQDSTIYQNFDFVKVWYFNSNELTLPKLQTIYEYSATINFVITFSEDISLKDRFALIEVTNNVDLSYCLMANNNQKIVTLYDITEGKYTISLTTLIGNAINLNGKTTITLDENSLSEITINIEINKSNKTGYYGKVIL